MKPRAWQLIALIGMLGVVCEVGWQARFGVASPARALLLVAIATCVGNPLRQATIGSARVRGFAACFGAGFVCMGVVYLVMRGLHVPRAVIASSYFVLAACGIWLGRWRGLMQRRVDLVSVVVWSVAGVLCARAEWLSELPQLTLPHPTLFAGIDTPLWLNLVYGLERSVPARELLFANETLNYHYGSGLLPLLVRATTGLPAHVAHATSVTICGLATGLLLAQVTQRLFAADRSGRRALGWAMPMLACLGFQLWVFNLPSALGNFLLVYALAELQRAHRWRSLWLTFPTFFLLMLTKEVAYVAAVLCAGCLGLWAFYERRDWRPLARLIPTFVVTRLLYAPLTHPDQGAAATVFREHLDPHWFWNELCQTSLLEYTKLPAAWLLASAAVAIPVLIRGKHRRDAATLIGASVVLMTMVALALVVRPQFNPPLDPLHAEWALKDMFQFHKLGGHIALYALLAAVIVALARRRGWARYEQGIALAASAVVAWFAEDHYFRVAPPGPDQQYEEYRGDNPIVPVLERIPVRRSLIAADHLNWNGENPHWAAFFGHRFYCLRRVRWAPAYRRYAAVVGKQDSLFRTVDFNEVAAIAQSEAITHVIVDKLHPAPWSLHAQPAFQTERYSVYEF